ncbi:MAG: SRPBCC domain-containing protein [Chloroflexota bacterium]
MDTKAIEKVIRIAARPETVFRLLIDPKEYVRWKGKVAELEPRPGGTYSVDFIEKGLVVGKYVEVVPGRRVVFTWGWDGNEVVPPGSSTVEIDLEPDGEGTRLRLVHRGLPEGAIATHREGWDFFLPRLANVAEGRDADAGHEATEKK